MRKLLISLLLLVWACCAHAVPALQMWRTYGQPDGTNVNLMLVGDENFHFFRTHDGIAVVQDEAGRYVYARLTDTGMAPTEIVAHDLEMRTAAEKTQVAQLGDVATMGPRRAAEQQPRFGKRVGEPTGNYTGSKKGLIIMVQFQDVKFTMTKQEVEDIANKEKYSNNYGAIGSVHDYFSDMSNGVFDLTFDVVGPVTLDRNCSYYGYNSGGQDQSYRIQSFVSESVLAAADSTDFSQYDWDGDGEVDQVFLLYAGYGEATGGPANTIWPHESFYMGDLNIDGVKVSTYACSNELNGSSDSVPMGLGVICHEFSHCLGLPDFYDTAKNGTQYGMDMWDVMGSGSYNGDAWIPAAYTGYERHFCGWRQYRTLDNPCKVDKMEPLCNGGETYQIVNPGNEKEYFLLENRHGSYGWDKGFYTTNTGSVIGGLMIYHVTYDENRWRFNTVNTTGKGYQCMTVVHADNSDKTTYDYYGSLYVDGDEYQGDLFPYRSGMTENHNSFSDESVPADVLNTPNSDGSYFLHTHVTNIRKQSRFTFFIYENGTQPWDGIGNVSAATAADRADVFSPDGRLVRKAVKMADIDNMPAGMYVIRGNDGSARKVVVK